MAIARVKCIVTPAIAMESKLRQWIVLAKVDFGIVALSMA